MCIKENSCNISFKNNLSEEYMMEDKNISMYVSVENIVGRLAPILSNIGRRQQN